MLICFSFGNQVIVLLFFIFAKYYNKMDHIIKICFVLDTVSCLRLLEISDVLLVLSHVLSNASKQANLKSWISCYCFCKIVCVSYILPFTTEKTQSDLNNLPSFIFVVQKCLISNYHFPSFPTTGSLLPLRQSSDS